jgi:hypothetical protein
VQTTNRTSQAQAQAPTRVAAPAALKETGSRTHQAASLQRTMMHLRLISTLRQLLQQQQQAHQQQQGQGHGSRHKLRISC